MIQVEHYCFCGMYVCVFAHVQSPSSSAAGSPLKPSKSARGVKDPPTSSPKAGGGDVSSAISNASTSSVNAAASPGDSKSRGAKGSGAGSGGSTSEGEDGGEMYYCLPWVEACALVTMCSYRSVTRRLSLVLLKEIRSLHMALEIEVGVGFRTLEWRCVCLCVCVCVCVCVCAVCFRPG